MRVRLIAFVIGFAAAFSRPLRRHPPRGMAGSADHHHRAVGRGRRRRSALARARAAAGEGSQGAVQRGAASRRQRRGRPHRDRAGEARRLHLGPRHGRDHHDALAGARADPAERLHRGRDHQRRCRRADRAHGFALQEREGADRGHQGEAAPATSRRRAPARAASGISVWSAGCSPRRWTRRRCRGCRTRAPVPAMQDLVAGGVDFVTASLPEGRALIDAGKARALAQMDSKRLALYPNVPTLKEATGTDWTILTWRGLLGPAGIPHDIRDEDVAALQEGASRARIPGLHEEPRLRRRLDAGRRSHRATSTRPTPISAAS